MLKVREIPQGSVIVDVREFPEFAAGHIEGARLAPLGRVERMASAWPREETLVLVCKAGGRAEQARRLLAAMDGELVSAVGAAPQSVVKMNYSGVNAVTAPVAMGTNVFWGDVVFGATVVEGERLERVATVTVFSYQEAGEL